jgi:predicted dienelactone hydrolase
MKAGYDPFESGGIPSAVLAIDIVDHVRNRSFPAEVWYPAEASQASGYPLVVYSHSSGGNRRAASYLCTHLSGHGYVVAALDHSEIVAPELHAQPGETAEGKRARGRAWIANRVPDLRLLLDCMLERGALPPGVRIDRESIGAVGHSFGGWTVLAAVDEDPRIGAVVVLAPGGASNPKPGILPLTLAFDWNRDVPTLYLVADDDISLPIAGMYELFERTPSRKQMAVLRRADHLHFIDDAERQHEAVRAMAFPPELAWIKDEMRPFSELCSSDAAHLFVKALTLSHFDAYLKQLDAARQFLQGDAGAELAARGVDALVGPPATGTTPQNA